ncbi:MAG: formylglycine-generating enzyme family protein [Rhodospirillaceae bacterium]|nr:formylglycine-generating enzyme family protein [Rhodospirillaceae bacterium]
MGVHMRGVVIGFALSIAVAGSAVAAESMKPGTVFRDCPTCPEMVVVPPGSFTMGSDAKNTMRGGEARPEGPARPVTIAKLFAAGRMELTNAQFRAFVKATGHVSSRDCSIGLGKEEFDKLDFEGPFFGRKPADDEAVVCVSWNDAKDYAAWMSGVTGKRYRLLTEAEWEYATKAGAKTKWPWGDNDLDACKYENTYDLDSAADMPAGAKVNWEALACHDGQGRIAKVGSYPPNTFGLYDMLGNVWEWVEDCSLELYPATPNDGSAVQVAANCEKRGVRGGSWYTRQDRHRTTFRGRDASTDQAHHFGIRIARDIE